MPDFPIIDAHVHLYDPQELPYSWMREVPQLDRRHDLVAFDASRGAIAVDGIVFVEVNVDRGHEAEEVAWVEGHNRCDGRVKGLVASAPLEKGAAVEEDLERLVAMNGVKGIRRLIELETQPGFCLQDEFIEGVRRLNRFALSFDICVRHWQLEDAVGLVRACPDTPFVLDHIGKPAIRDGEFHPWGRFLAELAELPNSYCKLSGVITEAASEGRWGIEKMLPFIDHVVDCFGWARLMYGSDWSVSSLTHDYGEWLAILDDLTRGCSEAERLAFYRDNAISFYRLDP